MLQLSRLPSHPRPPVALALPCVRLANLKDSFPVRLKPGRRAVRSAVEGNAVEFSAAVWLVFNPFYYHRRRVDLLACFTQVLPGLNLEVQ